VSIYRIYVIWLGLGGVRCNEGWPQALLVLGWIPRLVYIPAGISDERSSAGVKKSIQCLYLCLPLPSPHPVLLSLIVPLSDL
jgi:hypothetical protein